MSLLKLPEARSVQMPANLQWDVPSEVLSRWSQMPVAAADGDEATISIYDVIGEDFWTGEGFTAKRMSAALRNIGEREVRVKINSPGGSLPEGTAIFNELRKHPAKVTVDVMGWAASAASVIAMAGDEIRMGLGSFMFVHNSWGLAIGNRHAFADAAALFGEFDQSMVDIYAARTGRERKDIEALLDGPTAASDGTFMSAKRAVDEGFATLVDDNLRIDADDSPEARALQARRRIEGALAKDMTRKDRQALINDLLAPAASLKPAPRDAGRNAERDAGDITPGLMALIETMKG